MFHLFKTGMLSKKLAEFTRFRKFSELSKCLFWNCHNMYVAAYFKNSTVYVLVVNNSLGFRSPLFSRLFPAGRGTTIAYNSYIDSRQALLACLNRVRISLVPFSRWSLCSAVQPTLTTTQRVQNNVQRSTKQEKRQRTQPHPNFHTSQDKLGQYEKKDKELESEEMFFCYEHLYRATLLYPSIPFYHDSGKRIRIRLRPFWPRRWNEL